MDDLTYTEERLLEIETLVKVQGEVIAVMLSALRNHAESEGQGVALIYEQLRRTLADRYFYWPPEAAQPTKGDAAAKQWKL